MPRLRVKAKRFIKGMKVLEEGKVIKKKKKKKKT